jgi:hypothetical protein
LVDEAVARKLVTSVGATPSRTYGREGKAHLAQRLSGYDRAARFAPWFVLMDLDRDECAPRLRADLLPQQSARMCFRVAVREVESWLLADRDGMANFLRVARNRVPTAPDDLEDPKLSIVNAARHSRAAAIRADMIPRPGSGRAAGPAYPSRMAEFVAVWQLELAAAASDSLGRCLARLEAFVGAERAGLMAP